ncbi:restriction endonuclease subunit S [Seonamhaeicola sp.]|uniref:restriction endonuclease subunit S n=1 Tax=Seonamhaeicola sp. TaxID=1912245 RepID=UPI0026118047|nr:restriction endonuclease subunit S [Seonamhaeicola sp.]
MIINIIETTLEDIASPDKKSIISGPFGSNISKKYFKEDGIPVIRGNNLSTEGIKFKDSGYVFVTKEKADKLNCYAVKDDLVFTAVGTLGQVGIIHDEMLYKEYVISNKQLRLRIDKEKVSPLYAFYWFSSKWIQKLINQRNVGSTVPLINLTVLKKLPIHFPESLKTQNKIVEILESLNTKIEVNKKINAELEATAKLIYDYWFVQFDFPNKDGRPYKSSRGKMVYNETLKREIPEGWEAKDLKGIESNIITGKTPSTKIKENFGGDIPFITIDDIRQNRFIYTTERTLTKQGAETQQKKYIEENDICVSCIGTVGVIGFAGKKSQSNQQINTISNINPINRYYLYQYLNDYFNFNVAAKKGAVLSNMNKGEFESIPILNPNEELKKLYFDKIDDVFKSISNNIKQNQKLASLRDWLLPMLMNGQVTIGEQKDELNIAAELGAVYEKDKVSLDSLFETINYDYEVAAIVLLTRQILDRTYGRKFIHKMFSNIQFLESLPVFKELEFQENGWGMYSSIIKKTIENNKFIRFDEINEKVSVLNFNYKHIKEVSNWMKDEENQDFVSQVKQMLKIYQKPLINKDMDRIELLNTVLECMNVLDTDNFDSIYSKMKKWPMREDGYKNKAEKFTPQETRLMIDFIKEIQ